MAIAGLEVKDIDGAVFGSDKMSDWTVIAAKRRYTFPNPQHALYDRIAAVRQPHEQQQQQAGRPQHVRGVEQLGH